MTKTKAILELRRVVRRLRDYPMLKSCISDTCSTKKAASRKCIFCDADQILRQTKLSLK
jgi:hypothetical protein